MAQDNVVLLEIADGAIQNVVDTGRITVVFIDVDELRADLQRAAEKWHELQDMPDAIREHGWHLLEHEVLLALIQCKFCGEPTPIRTAHRHKYGYVGEECWDERLRPTE